jgi:hypothetical protein
MTDMLFSIDEARIRLGKTSRNSLYALLRSGALPSVTIGCRRFISGGAIDELIRHSSTTTSPAVDRVRFHLPLPVSALGVVTRVVGGRTRRARGAA